MEFVVQAQDAAERGHGISATAADLLDHKTLDGPDPLAVHIVDSGALDVVTFDERVSRA